ncbi:MAG TPA: hypothetical protein DF712_03005, partial [Balneola sp.]|nr:hypothetical protein [Balneola sp.]
NINSPESASKEFYGYGDRSSTKYLEIEEKYIIQTNLTWTDTNRINACYRKLPYSALQAPDALLFGIGSSPIVNPTDINRFGVRIHVGDSPFIPPRTDKDSEKQRKYHELVGTATAERSYFTFGEGHAYAEGTITLKYFDPEYFTHGTWGKVLYAEDSSLKVNKRLIPFTFYIKNVSHSLSVNPQTGSPMGVTTLTIDRASYDSRVPFVKFNSVPSQKAPKKKKNDKKPQRKTNE